MSRSNIASVVLLSLAACSGSHSVPEDRPVGDGLDPADPIYYEDRLYFQGASWKDRNTFLMKNRRALAVLVVGKPDVIGRYDGDEIWIFDVTNRTEIRGTVVPWDTTSTSISIRDCTYSVRVEPRAEDRILRIEGGGSWFELSLNQRLSARTATAGTDGRPVEGGFRILLRPRGHEVFREEDLKRAGGTLPVKPAFVVTVEYDGHFVQREYPIGDSGYVFVQGPQSVADFQVLKSSPGADSADFKPEDLFATWKASAVTIITDSGHGSGSFVTSDGLIITNYHVVDGAKGGEVVVRLSDNRELNGKVVATKKVPDLALVRVSGKTGDFQPMVLNPDVPKVGSRIVVIGTPVDKSLAASFCQGSVTGIRKYSDGILIQHQAPTNPGNSGGPVLDMKGRQVAVVVSGIDWADDGKTRPVEGINFAIPAAEVLEFIKENPEK